MNTNISSLSFYQEQIYSLIDTEQPQEITARIETHVLDFLSKIANQTPHDFMIIKTDIDNMNDGFGLINLGKKKKKRRLDNLKSIRSYSHIWLMLSKMNHLTRMQKHVSQREMFYCLTPRVKDQMESNRAIQEVVSIIQCPRECLGIFASSRGWIAGTLEWNEGYGWIDCAKTGTTLQIPGILPSTLKIQSLAKYIIVIEKDGVFKRLLEDRLFKTIPCILVTSCGFPDFSTRKLVYHLHKALRIPVLGLVDFNPFGLNILSTYKLGAFSSLESYRYCVPEIQWLGLHAQDLENLKGQPFERIDDTTLARLSNYTWFNNDEKYKYQIEWMKKNRTKVEIQALNNFGFDHMKLYIRKKILKHEYF